MPSKVYHLVIAEDDGPIVVPDVSPGGAARTTTGPDPYPLLEKIAAECSAADLEHFKLFALGRIQRQVSGAAAEAVARRAVAS